MIFWIYDFLSPLIMEIILRPTQLSRLLHPYRQDAVTAQSHRLIKGGIDFKDIDPIKPQPKLTSSSNLSDWIILEVQNDQIH